jgi:cbb3-type cytochrome oxidase maturation protein
MSVIYLLLTISIVVALVFFAAFIISVRSGQYDDSYTPSVRMLFEDEVIKTKPENSDAKIEKSIQLNKKQKL